MADLNSTLVRGNLRVSGKMYGDSSSLSVATTTKNGIMSATDKSNLDAIYGSLFNDDQDTVVNRLKDVLTVFNEYPEGTTIVSALNGKAPTSHASSSDTYGKGTTANYGHVKLSNDTLNASSSNTDGVAAGLGHKHSQYAPTSHASTATTYGVGTSSNYGHVKLGAAEQNGATATDGIAAPNGHTHSQYAPAGNYVTTDGDHGNIITYPTISGTATAKPFLISRTGSGTSEVVQQWIDDGIYHIKYINDETTSSIKWYLNNTDTENNHLTDASEHTMTLTATKNALKLKLDNTLVSMDGHTHSYNDLTNLPTSTNMEMESITYASLKSKRDNSQLVPGKYYRITDYECTTTQENTSSAGHIFDIIVTADEVDTLNENARAVLHAGDTYFASNNLAAWELKYSLDNDISKFAWAQVYRNEFVINGDTTTSPRLYRCPDLDNLYSDPEYSHAWVEDGIYYRSKEEITVYFSKPSTEQPVAPNATAFISNMFNLKTAKFKNGDFIETIGQLNTTDIYMLTHTYSNGVTTTGTSQTNGKGVIYYMKDEFNNECPYDFKNILFTKSGSYTNAYTFTYTENSTLKDASLLASEECYNNIIKEYINFSNKLQLNFSVFYSTATTLYCFSNIFGPNCYSNTFGGVCNNNTFGSDCYQNTFGDDCKYNTFGDDCCHNTFGDTCYYNSFGNDCFYITFGDSSSAINYCRYNIIENGCRYLYVVGNGTASYSSQLQNVHIHLGIKGTSSAYKTITVDRNLSYLTEFKPSGSVIELVQ